LPKFIRWTAFAAIVAVIAIWIFTNNALAGWIVFGLAALDLHLAALLDSRRKDDASNP
jgi:hypothetical protein